MLGDLGIWLKNGDVDFGVVKTALPAFAMVSKSDDVETEFIVVPDLKSQQVAAAVAAAHRYWN
jgi:hypothetical protein